MQMQRTFEAALIDAVSFLKELPRERDAAATAHSRLKHFQEAHPSVRLHLLVDQPPGSPRVDYDLLLGLPDASTVALSWRPDDGVPWNIEYADHWAANFVVTVNGWHATIQQALSYLKLWTHQFPDLMAELVNQTLIAQAIFEDPPPVSALEILAGAEEFRLARGFKTPEAMNRWLQETGLSASGFENLIRQNIQRRKFESRLTKDRVEPYFEAHTEDFEVIQFVLAETSKQEVAQRLTAAAGQQGLLAAARDLALEVGPELTASLNSNYASALPENLATASPEELVGPVEHGSLRRISQVLKRHPARLDEATRATIRKQLFRRWLDERREQATVRWHWL
jgi:putative peptide maturation system protein